MEKRGLGFYIERGQERIREWSHQLRERAELAMQGMSSLVQGAARAMRSGLQTSSEGGFEAVPALDQSPQRDQMPAIELDQPGQRGRDRQREQELDRERGRDGPDIGFGR